VYTALSPDDSQNKKPKSKWVLTKEAFDKLLALFSADPDEAAEKYEAMRRKLRRIFEWKLFPNAEELVDEAITRVARRLDEGEEISNVNGYFRRVAIIVAQENNRPIVRSLSLDDVSEPIAPDPNEDPEKERRLQCLDDCLDKLPIESRTLILKYYSYEQSNKISLRRQLADSLGMPMNALRIRAYRLRRWLETCLEDCLGQLG
jgi:RNA polymerase sigma factor (sigma-70 family)